MDPLQLLGMALDLIDAVAGTVTIVSLWYTWVMPAKKDPPTSPHSSGRAEIDRFLREARTCTDARADHLHEEHEHAKGALPRSQQL